MTQFSNKFKKLCFWSIFGPFSPFLGQKLFSWKIWLSSTTSYGFLAPCQNLEKLNGTIQRKCPDRWMEGQTEGQADPILWELCGYHQRSKNEGQRMIKIVKNGNESNKALLKNLLLLSSYAISCIYPFCVNVHFVKLSSFLLMQAEQQFQKGSHTIHLKRSFTKHISLLDT